MSRSYRAIGFKHVVTGQSWETDTRKMRVARMRKRLKAWANVSDFQADFILVTLTYRRIDGWMPRHVSEFMDNVRGHLGQRLYGYCWVAELQKRGAVHYHLILCVQRGARIPFPDRCGWWTHGMSKVQLVDSQSGAWAYLRKYVSKADNERDFPKGLRLFAVVIRRTFSAHHWRLRWRSLPKWLHLEFDARGLPEPLGEDIQKIRGGWVVGGEVVFSPWVVDWVMTIWDAPFEADSVELTPPAS